MMKKTATGHITQFTKKDKMDTIVCPHCEKIILSKDNLENKKECPYCGKNITLN